MLCNGIEWYSRYSMYKNRDGRTNPDFSKLLFRYDMVGLWTFGVCEFLSQFWTVGRFTIYDFFFLILT